MTGSTQPAAVTARLSHRDFDACSRALRQLYAGTSLNEFPDRLLPLVSGLVPVDYVSYNEARERPWRFVIRYQPNRSESEALGAQFSAHVQTHPLVVHFQQDDVFPRKTSDVATLRQFRDTAIYQQYYRHFGVKHQIIFTLGTGGPAHVGLALNRAGRDFSERDRAVLAFLSPHISQAYQNAKAATALAASLEQLGSGMATLRRAVILTDGDGRIAWLSSTADAWLTECFSEGLAGSRHLPPRLRRWLREVAQAGGSARLAGAEMEVPTPTGGRLVARCGQAGEGMFIIELLRERPGIDAAAAESLGLTPREAEILYWISEAKTNPEIALILNVSPRTVHKHVEHLLAKLRVEHRLAAQRRGWELRKV